jgi:uncharacterized hydrophobic protein (TIGR00341 family)
MELRLIEIYCPESECEPLQGIIKHYQNLDVRNQTLPDNWRMTRVLLREDETEKFTDELGQRFQHINGFRVFILGITATIPRPEPTEEPQPDSRATAGAETNDEIERISREELYASISNSTEISRNFAVLLGLSTVVAALGLLQNNLAVIVGAMVISPLLGPNVALSLGTTLADTGLARRALKTIGAGILIVLGLSMLLGFIINVDPTIPEIASRTKVSVADVFIALASGAAGASGRPRGSDGGSRLAPAVSCVWNIVGKPALATGLGRLVIISHKYRVY